MSFSLKNKKVLVVGATGFIGSNLVERLIREKAKVFVIIRSKSDFEFFRKKQIKCFFGDLNNYKSLDKATKNIEIVINASGALPSHKLSKEEYWNVNVYGVENLIKASVKNKVKKIIHLSTVGIYGEVANNIDEKQKPNPKGVYAESKLAGDIVINKYKDRINTVIIRPTIAYGPGDKRPVILSLSKLINKNILFLMDGGKNHLHTVYISNLIDAIILAANKKIISGEDFIIGDELCPTFEQLSVSIAKSLNIKTVKINLPRDTVYLFIGKFFSSKINFITDEKRYKIDKAKRILGYEPKINLQNGMDLTIKWYKENDFI